MAENSSCAALCPPHMGHLMENVSDLVPPGAFIPVTTTTNPLGVDTAKSFVASPLLPWTSARGEPYKK